MIKNEVKTDRKTKYKRTSKRGRKGHPPRRPTLHFFHFVNFCGRRRQPRAWQSGRGSQPAAAAKIVKNDRENERRKDQIYVTKLLSNGPQCALNLPLGALRTAFARATGVAMGRRWQGRRLSSYSQIIDKR